MKYRIPFFYDYVFPSFVMPNALVTEMGLIDFLHSLHSTKVVKNTSFFDQTEGYKDQTPVVALFGDAFGSWPNSLSSSNLFSPCYERYMDAVLDSIYFGKKKYGEVEFNRYVYLINVTPHLDMFTGVAPIGSKMNGEYFWKHMSAEALRDAQQGVAIVLLDYGQENFVEKQTYINLHKGLENSGIHKSNVILALNSFNAKEIYESWFTPEERLIEVFNWPFVATHTVEEFTNNPHIRVSLQDFQASRNTLRDNHYLFKIRRARVHRQALLFKLASDDLLQYGDWSCLSPIEFDQREYIGLSQRYYFEFDDDKVKDLISNVPKTLKHESKLDYTQISAWTDTNPDAHISSYFYICTETFTHGEHKSLTEKVFKPIANFQPFLFMAYPGALKMLQSLGFKTFSPFIDESYDDEIDEGKRLNMIYREIVRLSSMSKEEIHAWYWSMEDILIYNQKHLLSLRDNEELASSLIKYLHARVTQ